mmetsp:Transcript_19882/g.46408  ORF Transcript_19882/g.46408 Transcript_19882/m.46408 type:complete len:209 (+) Transcript_19882:234-860(+)
MSRIGTHPGTVGRGLAGALDRGLLFVGFSSPPLPESVTEGPSGAAAIVRDAAGIQDDDFLLLLVRTLVTGVEDLAVNGTGLPARGGVVGHGWIKIAVNNDASLLMVATRPEAFAAAPGVPYRTGGGYSHGRSLLAGGGSSPLEEPAASGSEGRRIDAVVAVAVAVAGNARAIEDDGGLEDDAPHAHCVLVRVVEHLVVVVLIREIRAV